MIYITAKQSPHYHQMSIEEFLFAEFTSSNSAPIRYNISNTKTHCVEKLSKRFIDAVNVNELIETLERFNGFTDMLRERKREELYNTFCIPKKSKGLRRIDAPNEELMGALYSLKYIFENDFHALYHTSAFAYIKHRSIVDVLKRHQQNSSKWFAKLDFKDFFGSTTLDFVMDMFSMIYPFSEVIRVPKGKEEFRKAMELAFLNGGLPQGTPISPLITNIMMIPVDFKLYNSLREFDEKYFVYTRYADDLIISSRVDFKVRDIEKVVNDILSEFKAPFRIKPEKTRYGSSAGSNWNLGLMLNKDNKITVGYKKKKQFQSMLYNYVSDKSKGINWNAEDLMTLQGLHSYYRMVEREAIDEIVNHFNSKLGVDVLKMIKEDLKP